MRIKKMPREQFKVVLQREWIPVKLVGDALPDWAKGISEKVLHSVIASGTKTSGLPYRSATIPSGRLVGGLDVYRYAPDDPVELNKDWYAVVVVPHQDNTLLVDGLFKDTEHWLNDIPSRLKEIEVLGYLKR